MSEPLAEPRDWGAPLRVRLVRTEERGRWQQALQQHHYLGCPRMVGEALWYVATAADEWVALLGWAAAALKCHPRDTWIGWAPALQWHRLGLVVNNVRFCLLPGWARPNLASRVLALNCRRLSADWERAYGHPVLLAETFVDTIRFRGTCYRAAGWQCLGVTRGFAKRNTGYVAHGHPKSVWVRPLRPGAVVALTAPFPPPCSPRAEEGFGMLDANRLPLEGAGGLMDLLQTVPDPRHRRGIRHPVRTVVALAICAAVAGARSFTAIAQWARGLSPEALRRLGATRRTPPSEPTIRRVLQSVDADQLDAHLGPWLLQVAARPGAGLSVDGKTLRGGHARGAAAPHLLSAILHQDAVVVAQTAVPADTTEIPVLPRLLAPLPLAGAVVTADALHTHPETARYLVEEKRADYVLPVKDNQPTLKQDIATLQLDAFPPAGH
jgi:Druantia protein DruA/DDE_Tnp_1-associated/Transposase DDE domain